MTLRHGFAFSQHALLEACQFSRPLRMEGARECRVHGAPAISCASPTKENAHEHTGPPKSPGNPARNGFTAYHVLSLVHGLFGHHRPRFLTRGFDISVAMPG